MRVAAENPSRMQPVAGDVSQLVAAARAGDQEAWDALVERFAGLVWHVIRGFRLSDAIGEDVYQTAWLRLAEHLDRIRNPEAVGGWLASTARNECLRVIKVNGREQLIDHQEIDIIDLNATTDQSVTDTAQAEILWQAFGALSEACQRLLRLLITDPPLSYDEVSEQLEMSVGSIGPTRARCLAKMRSSRGMHLLGHD